MVRKMCGTGFFGLFAVGTAVVGLGCANDAGNSGATATTTTRSAVTASSAVQIAPYRENDFGRPPTTLPPLPPAPPQAAAPSSPVAVSASQYAGHFSNKLVNKPSAAVGGAVPISSGPSAEYLRKQAAYLQQLQQLEPTLAGAPAEEQERRRATLKNSVLGQ